MPLLESQFRKRKKTVNGSWRMDETYIKVKGKWVYLYRAVDSCGNTIDFLLSAKRDGTAAKAFPTSVLNVPQGAGLLGFVFFWGTTKWFLLG
jgi:transposase-like protein